MSLPPKDYETTGLIGCKVMGLEIVAAREDVYDLEVPIYENFALAAGCFVHNSKDTTDAASGAYFNSVNSDEKTGLAGQNEPSIYSEHAFSQRDLKQTKLIEPITPPVFDSPLRIFKV